MYGWRGRIGILVPSVNVVVEPEAVRMAPEGVAVYSARMGLESSEELAGVADLADNATAAARELAAAQVDVIAFACTTASFYEGAEAERRLQESIEQAAGVPTITAMGAVAEAITALQAHRIALSTPYSDHVNTLATAFLRAKGFEVVSAFGQGIHDTAAIGFLDDERIYSAAKSALHPDAQVLFLSCTNMPTLPLIPLLESDTGLPVVASNQALMWSCLQRMGVRHTGATDYGVLMSTAAAPPIPVGSLR